MNFREFREDARKTKTPRVVEAGIVGRFKYCRYVTSYF